MGRCVHFNGLMNDRCAAGVCYADVKPAPPVRGPLALPCFALDDNAAPCEHQRFPTREEAEEYERETHARFERMMGARKRIVEVTSGRRGVSGTTDCPVCGKRLGYSVAGNNGHIWAKCETEGCVAWIE